MMRDKIIFIICNLTDCLSFKMSLILCLMSVPLFFSNQKKNIEINKPTHVEAKYKVNSPFLFGYCKVDEAWC